MEKLIKENNVLIYDTGQPKIRLGDRNIKIADIQCKDIYSFLINEISEPPTAVAKWQEKFTRINVDLWQDVFNSAFEICDETLLQTFQYKILHRCFSL